MYLLTFCNFKSMFVLFVHKFDSIVDSRDEFDRHDGVGCGLGCKFAYYDGQENRMLCSDVVTAQEFDLRISFRSYSGSFVGNL